jgi:hypothetical protein
MRGIVHPFRADTSAGGRRPGRARLLLRFGVGMEEIGIGRLLEVLRAVEDRGAAALGEVWAAPAEVEPRAAVRDVVVGALASAPAAFAAVLASVEPARARLGRIAGPGRRLLGRIPGARSVSRRWRAARAGAAREVARLSAIGHSEVEAGRRLADTFLSAASVAVVARVAESPELKRVIAEQSQGLAVTAVNELRERSVRADNVAESVLRRLTGRSRSGGSK